MKIINFAIISKNDYQLIITNTTDGENTESVSEKLAKEILKIRSNKILAKYLDDTKQFIKLNPLSREIEFYDCIELTPRYIKTGCKDFSLLEPATISQHPAQHQPIHTQVDLFLI